MKNIVLAIPRLTGGGAERVVSVWANELCNNEYQISIVLFSRSNNEYIVNERVKIYSLVDSISEYFAMSAFEKLNGLRSILKKIAPDYIISFLPAMQVWMMLASVGLQIKRIETIRVNPWKVNTGGKINRIVWKNCFRTCYKIIIQATGQELFFSKNEQKKIVLIPNPIDEKFLIRAKHDINPTPNKFIAVGRIDKQKNYPMMIKAFFEIAKERTDIVLKIYGDGEKEYVTELEKLIKKYRLTNNVYLMGRTPNIEVEYQKNDIFLMSSDFEGLPNSLMEAMASGLICISTDCQTGPSDLIENGKNGYLVPVGDSEQMSRTIFAILHMSESERKIVSEKARNKILEYCSKENSVDRLKNILY